MPSFSTKRSRICTWKKSTKSFCDIRGAGGIARNECALGGWMCSERCCAFSRLLVFSPVLDGNHDKYYRSNIMMPASNRKFRMLRCPPYLSRHICFICVYRCVLKSTKLSPPCPPHRIQKTACIPRHRAPTRHAGAKNKVYSGKCSLRTIAFCDSFYFLDFFFSLTVLIRDATNPFSVARAKNFMSSSAFSGSW